MFNFRDVKKEIQRRPRLVSVVVLTKQTVRLCLFGMGILDVICSNRTRRPVQLAITI